MIFEHDFTKDLDHLLRQIYPGAQGFAFTRFADGEHAVLEGSSIQGMDWQMKPEFEEAYQLINKALDYRHSRYWYGVSCQCCDQVKSKYYKDKLIACWDRVTFSNLFVNGNYEKSKLWLESLNKSRTKPFIILNEKAKDKILPFDADRVYMPANILEVLEKDPNTILYENEELNKITQWGMRPVLVAAGPMSEILIYYLWTRNQDNYYIDIGSIIDPYIHGDTRIYHHHEHWKKLICTQL